MINYSEHILKGNIIRLKPKLKLFQQNKNTHTIVAFIV